MAEKFKSGKLVKVLPFSKAAGREVWGAVENYSYVSKVYLVYVRELNDSFVLKESEISG